MKLILGAAGEVHPYHLRWVDDTWTKVDKYIDDGKTIMMDASELLFTDDSIEAIYASHILEHFSYLSVPSILRNWFSKLQPGGWLHINVPDLEWACREILKNEEYTSPVFNSQEAVINNIFYGNQVHEGEYHKSGYTELILHKVLRDAGFADIQIVKEYDVGHEMGVLLADCYRD